MARRLGRGIALVLTMVALGAAAAPARQGVEEAQAARTLDQVIGADDGYGISILSSGDFMANMEPCGCRIPMGGIAWRAGYAKALATKGAAVLQLDAGNVFQSAYAPGYAQVDDLEVKNEWVLRAAELLDVRALNVTAADLAFLSKRTETAGFAERAKQFPALDRFVSANVAPADAKHAPFKPYVVETVSSPKMGEKPVRVGVIGVTEIPRGGGAVAGYTISDPFVALRKVAPEVRAKCDVLVVLAYLDKRALQKVEPAAGVAVDAVVAAHQYAQQALDKVVDAPVYTYPPNEAKAISELRFYPPAAGATGRYGKVASRYVALTDAIPRDEAADKMTWDAAKAYRKP